MAQQTTSSGNLFFYISGSTSFPFTVTAANLIGITPGSSSVTSKRFEARAGVTIAAVSETFAPGAVNTGTDIITVTRNFATGEKVRFSTTTTLPVPLVAATDYYVIRYSATQIRISTTLAYAYAGTYIDLTTQGVGTHTIALYTKTVAVYQQETKPQVSLGVSDGITEWQEFKLPDLTVLAATLVITINSVVWTQVTTFVDSILTDTVYRFFYDSDNSARIQFGNGTYGAIPGRSQFMLIMQ